MTGSGTTVLSVPGECARPYAASASRTTSEHLVERSIRASQTAGWVCASRRAYSAGMPRLERYGRLSLQRHLIFLMSGA